MPERELPEEVRKKIEKEEAKDLDYETVKRLLKEKHNHFSKSYIFRLLHEKENLRKVFLAILEKGPARISEIFEKALLTKPTCYAQLFKLLDLGLVKRIFVSDVIRENPNNNEHKLVKEKFLEWSKSMPDKLKRYYLAKTSYWMVTKRGEDFAGRAFYFDQEFREKEREEGKDGNL